MMTSLLRKAEKAREGSRFKDAQTLYQAILRRSRLDTGDKVEALLGLADVERIQGYFPRSLNHYQKVARLLDRHDNAYWDAQVGWALAARASGKPRQALALIQRALAVYRKEKDREGQAFTHWALGGTLRIAGRMKEGLRELQTSFQMFKASGNSEGVSYACCALGGLYRMLGRYGESGKYYREANRRMRRRKDTFGTAYSYCGLGNVERMAGRFRRALPFYRKAENLYGAIGDRVSYAYTLWSIGTTHKMLGRYAEARQAFQKADGLFQKTGDTRGRIYTLLGFAEILFLRGERTKGDCFWKKAAAVADKSDFAWEKLHVEALKGGRLRPLASRYQKTGSFFHPESLPVNWP